MGSRRISALVAAAAAGLSAVALTGCLGFGETVVPDVKGQPPEVAQRVLAGLGFSPTLKQVNAATPKGLVSSTEPVAGTSTTSDTVTIRVSMGPALPVLPDTTNLEGDLAAEALRAQGLKVDQTVITSALVRAGTVVRSSPPAGRAIKRGETVVLLVSGGARTTAVPDLDGVTAAEAVKSLQLARLRALVIPTPGIGKPGHVGAQAPAPGQVSAVGTTVRLWVDQQPKPVRIPKLTGLTGGSASAILQRLGIEPRFVSKKAMAVDQIGAVLKQSPAVGATVMQGGSATLVVGIVAGRQQVKQPQLAQSFGLLAKRHDVFSFVYDKAACPFGRGSAQIVSDLAIPYRKGTAKIVTQGPVDLGDGRVAQMAVVETNGEFVNGSADLAIRIQPCPQQK